MEVSPLVNTILFAALTALLFWFNLTSPSRYLFLCGFLLPLMTPGLSVGINLLWYLLVGPLSLLLLAFSPQRSASRAAGFEVNWLIIYTVVVSGIWMCFEYLDLERFRWAEAIDLGAAQAVYKMPVQTASFVFQLLAFYVVPARARTVEQAGAGVSGLLAGCVLSIVTGLLLSVTTGTGMFAPPGRGVIEIGESHVVRIGGLSGEPKMLGAFLVIVASFLLASFIAEGKTRRGRRHFYLFLFVVAGLALTYSTSAWLGFAAMMSVFMPMLLFHRKRARWALFWVVGTVGVAAGTQIPLVSEAIELRVEQRVFNPETREIERSKDYYVVDVYSEKPQHMLFGFGLGGLDLEAIPHLLRDPKYAAERQYVRTPTPSVNFMRLLGDIGIAGLAMLSWIVYRWRRRLRMAGEAIFALFIISAFFGLMFVSINAIACYVFLCGAVLTHARLRAGATPVVRAASSAPPSVGMATARPTRTLV